MLDIILSNRFKKDLNLAAKRGYKFFGKRCTKHHYDTVVTFCYTLPRGPKVPIYRNTK